MDFPGLSSRILVTGATGFVGRHFLPALIQQYGAEAVTALVNPTRSPAEESFFGRLHEQGAPVIECDLLNLPAAKPSLPPFDLLYHLAAVAETENPAARFESNSAGTQCLLEWLAPALEGKLVIFTGTLASVDRDYPTEPMNETSPCRPRMPYGQTKLAAEECLRKRAKELGFDWTILRLCTIVGRGYRKGGMFDLFPRLLAQNALATRFNWPGRASFLGVNDLVRILLETPRQATMRNQLFVLSNQENPTFDKLLDQIAALHNISRQRLALPRWFWEMTARFTWRAVDYLWLPYRWRNACWRISHLIHDGICADAVKLNAIVGSQYQSVADMLCDAYER